MAFRSGFRPTRKRRLMSEINVVPYIDVTLILLIIFMITAPIVQQAVTVELPQTPAVNQTNNAKAKTEHKPFVITVTEEGYYKTSENPEKLLSSKQIATEVIARSQLNAEQEFYIQGDRMTPYQNVMHLFVLLKANGVEQVSLLTEPESP